MGVSSQNGIWGEHSKPTPKRGRAENYNHGIKINLMGRLIVSDKGAPPQKTIVSKKAEYQAAKTRCGNGRKVGGANIRNADARNRLPEYKIGAYGYFSHPRALLPEGSFRKMRCPSPERGRTALSSSARRKSIEIPSIARTHSPAHEGKVRKLGKKKERAEKKGKGRKERNVRKERRWGKVGK